MDVLGGGWTHFTTNNVRNLHEMVVHDVGEVIRRIPVRLHEHKVLLGLLLLERPVDGVSELGGAEARRVEADHVRLPRGSAAVRLRAGDGTAGARVGRRAAGVVQGALLGLEVLGRAEAAVRRAVGEERLRVLVVCL